MKHKSPITIFIVNDNALTASAIKQEIEQLLLLQPVSISIFSTGEQCELFMKNKPDIAIVDYNLNDEQGNVMTGISTIRKIKAIDSRIQVIMLTRNENADIAVQALQYGAHDYIVKNNYLFKKLKLSLLQCITILELRRSMREQVSLGIMAIVVVFLMFGVAVGLHAYSPT